MALSFDADHETIPLRDGDESPMRISQGQYGTRQGVPRIRALLEREQIQATLLLSRASPPCCIPTRCAASPATGHEIGIHSWIHERNTVAPLRGRARPVAARRRGAGRGWPAAARGHAHGELGFLAQHADIIREMGLLYDSSLMADDDPYELIADGNPTGIVELPPEWIRDDAVYFNMAALLRPAAVHAALGGGGDFQGRVRRRLATRAGCSC